jgi:hypothetical protein
MPWSEPMATRLQPRLHQMINRKRSDLENAIMRHKELLIGIDGALERSSDSLAVRFVELDRSYAMIERIYGELVFLSDVAGVRPPRRPPLDRGQ